MTAMRSSLVVAIITLSCAAAGAPTLLLALMVRDEEANLRANLPAFSGLADFVVCGIDDRSRDGSARAVAEALPDVPRWVFYFRFDGFGRGRTGVFREAWRKFPEASHVLVLDPDWELDAPRASRAHLNADERTFLFKVWDRNGMTSRTMNWLVKHEANLTFEHQLHEQLVQPNAGPGPQRAHVLPWEFAEREVRGRDTWHSAATAHGHSQSYERYLFDLELLDMDLADLGPDDPHTLFYLGVTHLSALDAMLGIGEHERTPETDYHVAEGVKYLTARVDEALLARERATFAGAHEHTWGALRWLAHAHHFSTRDFARARTFYGRCAAYDPGRRDCAVFLAKLCRDEGRHGEAFALAFDALAAEAAPAAPRDALKMVDNFYVPRCTLPLEASLALLPALEIGRPAADAQFQIRRQRRRGLGVVVVLLLLLVLLVLLLLAAGVRPELVVVAAVDVRDLGASPRRVARLHRALVALQTRGHLVLEGHGLPRHARGRRLLVRRRHDDRLLLFPLLLRLVLALRRRPPLRREAPR